MQKSSILQAIQWHFTDRSKTSYRPSFYYWDANTLICVLELMSFHNFDHSCKFLFLMNHMLLERFSWLRVNTFWKKWIEICLIEEEYNRSPWRLKGWGSSIVWTPLFIKRGWGFLKMAAMEGMGNFCYKRGKTRYGMEEVDFVMEGWEIFKVSLTLPSFENNIYWLKNCCYTFFIRSR